MGNFLQSEFDHKLMKHENAWSEKKWKTQTFFLDIYTLRWGFLIADRWSSRCIRIISSHTSREEKKWVSSLQSWFWFLSTLNISWFLFIIGCAIHAISLVCLDGFISLYVVLFECSVTYAHAAQHYLEREREWKEILKSSQHFCYFSVYDHW